MRPVQQAVLALSIIASTVTEILVASPDGLDVPDDLAQRLFNATMAGHLLGLTEEDLAAAYEAGMADHDAERTP